MDQSDPQNPNDPSVTGVSANARVVTEDKSADVADSRESTNPYQPSPDQPSPNQPSRQRLATQISGPRVLHVDSFRGDVINAVRGFCMGAADTVPGDRRLISSL